MSTSPTSACFLRHIALDCSHLERREQLLEEETSRRAANFTGKKNQLTNELQDIEVMMTHSSSQYLNNDHNMI